MSQAGGGLFRGLQTKFLNPVENGPNDRFRIKPMNFLMKPSLSVMDSSVGKGCTPYILHAMLRIPGTVEVINAEAPLALMFKRVHHLFEVPAVHTVWRKVLDYLEGRLVIQNQLSKLCIRDHM